MAGSEIRIGLLGVRLVYFRTRGWFHRVRVSSQKTLQPHGGSGIQTDLDVCAQGDLYIRVGRASHGTLFYVLISNQFGQMVLYVSSCACRWLESHAPSPAFRKAFGSRPFSWNSGTDTYLEPQAHQNHIEFGRHHFSSSVDDILFFISLIGLLP